MSLADRDYYRDRFWRLPAPPITNAPAHRFVESSKSDAICSKCGRRFSESRHTGVV